MINVDPLKTEHLHYVALEQIFSAERDPSLPLFLSRQHQPTSWQDWLVNVARWRQRLNQRTEQRWGLYHPDAGEFSARLFALLSLNKTVCIPGNRQPAFVQLLAERVDGFIGHFDGAVSTLELTSTEQDSLTVNGSPLTIHDNQLAELKNIRLDTSEQLIEVFTSGSSGEPQAIPKTLRQLSEEVTHLHQSWGDTWKQSNAFIVSTVSHQHIYGLLFRVLWPLAAGWCSDSHECEYLEELALRRWDNRPRLLISSPTHLSRLPDELEPLVAENLSAIFSSGAPLAREASLNVRTRLNTGVREVFGSSETGGIAWRIQNSPNHDAAWQPMPGIEVRQNTDTQCLDVRSSHLHNETEWYNTSDRIHMNAQGHFTLLGRADRIIKLEGKRLSLDEMEKHLQQTPWVEQAHLLVLNNVREELAAVLVLTESGQTLLNGEGKRALNLQLKDTLLNYFERPTLPRKWRYVEQLPVNSQGKLQRQPMVALFSTTAFSNSTTVFSNSTTKLGNNDATSAPTFPLILDKHLSEDGSLRLQLKIPADLLYFDGHFASAPILPGVVQIHWAEHYARETFALTGEFLRMEVIKFQKVINPGQVVTLHLSYQADKHKIIFSYSSGAEQDAETAQHSSGRLVLSECS